VLHVCIYNICHFEHLMHCAYVTDLSTTHFCKTGDFSRSSSDVHSFLLH
jgi:hypothetical protein